MCLICQHKTGNIIVNALELPQYCAMLSVHGLVKYCGNIIPDELELPQSWAKPSIYHHALYTRATAACCSGWLDNKKPTMDHTPPLYPVYKGHKQLHSSMGNVGWKL